VSVIPDSIGDPGKNLDSRFRGNDIKKKLPSYKVEVKNINSFNFVKKAVEYEIERHIDLLQEGKTPDQETRGFDSKKGVTYSQRSKEQAHDYRYFPEPDIRPLNFSQSYIDSIKVPELPRDRINSYEKLGIKYADAFNLSRNKDLGEKFKQISTLIKKDDRLSLVDVANFIINKKETANLKAEEIYGKLKEIKGPKKIDEKLLVATIEKLIEVNKKVVEDYQKGKQNAIMFLVGQVMKEMKGKADALVVRQKLIEALKSK